MNDIWGKLSTLHYGDVIMDAIASQITSLTIVYSIVYSDADQRKHQSSASLAFVRRIHREPVNSPHKWPVTRKMFPFDDVIIDCLCHDLLVYGCHLCKISKYMIWFWIELKYWWVHYLLQFIIIHKALKFKNLFQNAPVDSPYKGPVMRKLLPWYEVSMHFIDSKSKHHLHYH